MLATGLAAAGLLSAAAAGAASAGTAKAAAPAAAPAPATPTALPAPPTVPLSVTNGTPAPVLLGRAVTLSRVGAAGSGALRAALAATQAKLDTDAVTARRADAAAAAANARAAAALQNARAAQAAYDSLAGAIRQAALFLYTTGTRYVSLNPSAGPLLAYAADYADTTLTPDGLLQARHQDAEAERRALSEARAAQHQADAQDARAARALAGEAREQWRLKRQLASVAARSAAQVAADHTDLAFQAGTELRSATDLEFTPKDPLPAPLATTPVALAWAFAELGKPYLWGATGPDRFDCSGLTQFVWRQAGVEIPRVAADQDAWTIPVPLSQLLPGDLVFYGTTDIHHVGIYIGGGLMINAPHTGDVVRVTSIWWSDLAGFGRVHAAGVPVPLHAPPSARMPAPPAVVPTARPVPSQPTPPHGWKPSAGSTSPIAESPSPPGSTTTATTTSGRSTTSTSSTTSTTATTAASPNGSTTTATLAPAATTTVPPPATSTTVPPPTLPASG